jgi:signal transduction histidine kinase/CheY-like chemotaxis protein
LSSPTGPALRQRLIILIAVAIFPLAMMAGGGLYFLARQQGTQAERVGVELARSVANAVDTELNRSITVLETLATTTTLDSGDLTAFRQRALRVLPTQPSWAAIVLADPGGNRLVDTRLAPGSPMQPTLEPDSFGRVVESRRAAVGNLANRPQEGWVFPVRVPVLREGEVKYVLSALVAAEAIHQLLLRQHVADDWVISIVDARGRRVARSRAHAENLGGQLSPSAAQLIASGTSEGFGVTETLEGDRIYTPFARLQPSGWVAVLGFPTALAETAARQSLAAYGAGVVLSIGLGTLAALAMSRSLTRPMRELREAAEAAGHGELPAVPQTPIEEIREVGRALASAAAQLQSSRQEREQLLINEQRAREAAERANRVKEEFMAVLSHELRTPLNAVYGWARLLQDDRMQDPAMIARAKDAIVRNADAQLRLIDELLDLARITSGKLHLSIRDVNVAEVLHAALDAVRPAAVAKGITLAPQFDPDAGTLVGDPARLQQIFWNLLVNAVKFTDEGGAIAVTLERRDGHLRVMVTDNGHGIDPNLLPQVFDRFRQADSSSTRVYGGLGLGLALVKHLTELHGGTVHAHSDGKGRGATFTVSLPIADAAAAASTAPAGTDVSMQPRVRLDGVRVLVVDNEPDALTLTETILVAAGAVVQSCDSAAEGFRVLREWQPDVLLSDIEMPHEDGYTLLHKVRALPPELGGAIPAIALSAYGRPGDRERSISAGFNMHVPKPVDPGELTAIVAGIAGRADMPPARSAPISS